ncbi:unnamed protein product [Rotaria sp. Silwood1]|nr:unnamed protein product [Rotaria sp. Silwood1]
MRFLFSYLLGLSFNQPNISLCSSWSPNASTIVGENSLSQQYTAIFVNTQNTIYAASQDNDQILIWNNKSPIPTRNISVNLSNPGSLFVTNNEDIYVDNGFSNNRVDKLSYNATISERVTGVNGSCTGLFIDSNQSLYCSLMKSHRVVKHELEGTAKMWTSVAGTGCPGPVPNALDHPHGIYVDIDFSLYVADTYNNRIQRFAFDKSDGSTVAGFGSSIHFLLNRPTGIVLDADNYLFIVDSHNHRIVRSTQDGFRCIAGCSSTPGSNPSQLRYPYSLAFDKSGNILVTDMQNRRIQLFRLTSNPRGKSIYYVRLDIRSRTRSFLTDAILFERRLFVLSCSKENRK